MRPARPLACVVLSLAAALASGAGCTRDAPPPDVPTTTAVLAPEPLVSPEKMRAATASSANAAPAPSGAPEAARRPDVSLPEPAPSTLAEAIQVTRPRMADSASGPDDGSIALVGYWRRRMYPWAQLQGVPEFRPGTFLSGSDQGKRVCATGVVQSLVILQPRQYEATLDATTGERLSIGAVGDITGIKQGDTATFCGIASGIVGTGATRAIRATGYFDTPANRAPPSGSLKPRVCCLALQQNAVSLPPPQNQNAMMAAQFCNASLGTVSDPQQKAAMLDTIRAMLHGSILPAACR